VGVATRLEIEVSTRDKVCLAEGVGPLTKRAFGYGPTSDNTLGVTRRPLRGLATQPMKRVAWEGRGNPFADLTVSSGTS